MTLVVLDNRLRRGERVIGGGDVDLSESRLQRQPRGQAAAR